MPQSTTVKSEGLPIVQVQNEQGWNDFNLRRMYIALVSGSETASLNGTSLGNELGLPDLISSMSMRI